MNTPDGRRKAGATIRERYGEDFYRKMGSAGAHSRKNPYRPMKDPEVARQMQKLSVEARRKKKVLDA